MMIGNIVLATNQQDTQIILRIDPEISIMNQYFPFENYKKIHNLSFENNKEIETIPDSIKHLDNLKILNIKRTKIRNLPHEFIRKANGLEIIVDPTEFQEYGEGDSMGYREIISKCKIEGLKYNPTKYTREQIKVLLENAPLYWNFEFFVKIAG